MYVAERDSDITQIAAVDIHTRKTFSTFVKPSIDIPEDVVAITGISCDGAKEMYYRGEHVKSLDVKEGLTEFFNFLGPETVLLGHNVRSFDSQVLFNAATSCGLLDTAKDKIKGFIDTFLLFESEKKGLPIPSYKQPDLFSYFCPSESYVAHNALSDVHGLLSILEKAKVTEQEMASRSVCTEHILSSMCATRNKKLLRSSWEPLTSMGVMPSIKANYDKSCTPLFKQ